MLSPDSAAPSLAAVVAPQRPWWRELTRYHWFVFVVAALGWLFDTMDQQLFVAARTPAIRALTGDGEHVLTYAGYATSVFLVGWASGGLLFGWMGDRWGRARTMMLTILVYSLFTGLSALSRSWLDFALYRFLTGMGVGGEFAAGVSLLAEVMPPRVRPYALGLLQASSAIGNMTAVGISLWLPPQAKVFEVFGRDLFGWQAMFLVGVLPGLLVVFLFGRLREPESWQRARKDPTHHTLGDVRELFRDPRWRRNTVVGVTLAGAGVMGLWGIGFWTPELIRGTVLKGLPAHVQDWYASLSLLLQNLASFFGVFAFTLLTGWVGRRPAFAVSLLLALAATVVVFGFMTAPAQIWWMSPLLGFCNLMVFGGYAIYFPELYPTRLRSTGTSFCYNVARYLAAAAPFMLGHLTALFTAPALTPRGQEHLSQLTLLSTLGSVDNPFRYAALAVSSVFLVGLLALPFAPETRGKPLPE
jgi:MFS family permease